MHNLDSLALSPPDVELTPEAADEVADLARRITQVMARNAGITLDERHVRPYAACTANERAAMRLGAIRVVQSLVLLGYLEPQSVIVRP